MPPILHKKCHSIVTTQKLRPGRNVASDGAQKSHRGESYGEMNSTKAGNRSPPGWDVGIELKILAKITPPHFEKNAQFQITGTDFTFPELPGSARCLAKTNESDFC